MGRITQSDVLFSTKPYSSPFTSIGTERIDNFYCQFAASESAKQGYYFVGIQGLHRLVDQMVSNPCRGMFTTSNSRTFGVWGTQLVELSNSGLTRTVRGQILTSGPIVHFAENGTVLMLVDGSFGYTLTLASNSFARITDQYFPGINDPTLGPTHVVSVDNHFIVNQSNTKNYYWSSPGYIEYAFDITAPTTYNYWNGLNYGTKMGDNDVIVGMASLGGLLILFGSRTTEFHHSTGNAKGQLFTRVDNALLNFGCLAPNSIATIGDHVYWLGSDRDGTIGMYRVGADFTIERVSDFGHSTRWQTYSQINDAFAYSYAVDAHQFVDICFPHGTSVDNGGVTGATWSYDITSKTMTRRTSYDKTSGVVSMYQGIHSTYNRAWNMSLRGDKTGNAVYFLDNTYYANDTPVDGPQQNIQAVLTGPIAYDVNLNIFVKFLILNHQPGFAPRLGPGSDPLWAMRYSHNAGNTWGKSRTARAGSIGEYQHQTKWNLLGVSRNRVYEFSTTDPFKRLVLGYTLGYEVGI